MIQMNGIRMLNFKDAAKDFQTFFRLMSLLVSHRNLLEQLCIYLIDRPQAL